MSRCTARLVCIPWLLACSAGPVVRGPAQVTADYAAALRAGDAARAHSLLTEDAKRRLPLAEFERMLRDHPQDVESMSQSLSQLAEEPEAVAVVTAPGGERLMLRLEEGRWKAELESVDLYSQASPRAAVRAFIRAYRAERFDVLLRFVPNQHLPGLDAAKLREAWLGTQKREMSTRVQLLELALPGLHVDLLGNRATVAYGPAMSRLHLLFEDGLWKIEDFDDSTPSAHPPPDE